MAEDPRAWPEPGTIHLTFTSNLHYVRPIRHFVTALCNLAEYSEEETESIGLVATELLNNSIEHGCKNGSQEIRLRLLVEPKSFRAEVIDPGEGGRQFAEHALQMSQTLPPLEQPRGRGLYLIRSYMDEVDVSYAPDVGTRIYIRKARTS